MYYKNHQQTLVNLLLCSIVIIHSVLSTGCSSDSSTKTNTDTVHANGVMGDGTLDQVLERVLDSYDVPGTTALFLHGQNVLEKGAAGLRNSESTDAVTVEDKWHIGSITKSMTSTLGAMQVEQGLITWDTTIIDVFPEWVDDIKPEYHDVQFDELLSHTGGISPSSSASLDQVDQSDTDITNQRRQFTKSILNQDSQSSRGEYAYSNGGYIVAGTMLERVTGLDWESLMEQQLFAVLEMNSSGFGAPGANGLEPQPLGHIPENGKWLPIPANHPEADNPALFGPSGTVHTTLNDITAYIMLHLNAASGSNTGDVLSNTSFTKLHTPVSNIPYSLGWTRTDSALTHIGSNNRSLSQIIIVPEFDIALFIAINAADPFAPNGGTPLAMLNEIGQILKSRFDALQTEQ